MPEEIALTERTQQTSVKSSGVAHGGYPAVAVYVGASCGGRCCSGQCSPRSILIMLSPCVPESNAKNFMKA